MTSCIFVFLYHNCCKLINQYFIEYSYKDRAEYRRIKSEIDHLIGAVAAIVIANDGFNTYTTLEILLFYLFFYTILKIIMQNI